MEKCVGSSVRCCHWEPVHIQTLLLASPFSQVRLPETTPSGDANGTYARAVSGLVAAFCTHFVLSCPAGAPPGSVKSTPLPSLTAAPPAMCIGVPLPVG